MQQTKTLSDVNENKMYFTQKIQPITCAWMAQIYGSL